jgi:tetratricopeptide (TPR) repeat protein/TolB-like protein
MAEENSLAIMYFENIADPEDPQRLGEIVTNLLITDLSESQYMQVVSSQRMYDILKALGREGAKVIDRDVASRVAAEARAEWMLLGSILQVDPQVVVTSQLVEVETGKVIASQRVEGGPSEDIFSLVDHLAVEIREDLSLPVAAQNEPDPAVADVTTHSPEAYRYYLEGREYFRKLYWVEAAESFNRALGYDSTFAMAYARLATMEYWWGGTRYDEFLAKAVKYSDHASWKEKRYIHAQAAFVSGDYDRAIEEIEELLDRYPDDKRAYLQLGLYSSEVRQYERAIQAYTRATEIDPLYKMAYNLLAYVHNSAGNHEKSIEAINKYIVLAPDEANPYDTRGDLYAYNGDLDRAIESYLKTFEIKPDFAPSKLGRMYLFKRDYEGAERYFQYLCESSDKGDRALGRMYLALIPLRKGQFDEALRVLDDGMGADRMEQVEGPLANKHFLKAMAYEEKGDLEFALQEVRKCMEILRRATPSETDDWTEEYARLLAKAGDFAEAEQTAETLRQNIEKSDKSSMYLYRYAVGCIEFARGNFDEAIVNLEEAVEGHSDLQIRYALARSYLETARLGNAVEMFDKALSRYDGTAAFFAPWAVKAHYFLGTAYERSGWTAEAMEQYEEFLETWKDADPGIPEVEDARRRLESLPASKTSRRKS